jgi:hypothetical protein
MAACEYSLLHVVCDPMRFFLFAATVCPGTKDRVKGIAFAGTDLDEAATKHSFTMMKPICGFDANVLKQPPCIDRLQRSAG